MKVLVTGGAGFIGSHLTDALVEAGEDVRVLDNLSTGTMDNLQQALPHINFIEGDIRDPDTVFKACEGRQVVFHLAALGSVPRSIDDPLNSHQNNTTGTVALANAARQQGVRRLIFSSSSSVYGRVTEPRQVESLPPRPLSPYAVSKYASEEYLRVFGEIYGLETTILRYFNVFGPRQKPDGPYAAVIPKFIRTLIQTEETPQIHGDGTQQRDFTYVANVVAANIAAATAPYVSAGRAYNIACGQRTSINELYLRIQEITGRRRTPTYIPARAGDIPFSQADTARAQAEFGWQAKIGVTTGLAQTVSAYQAMPHPQVQASVVTS